MLQCVAVCCSVLQCVAVCCSGISFALGGTQNCVRVCVCVCGYVHMFACVAYVPVNIIVCVYIYACVCLRASLCVYITPPPPSRLLFRSPGKCTQKRISAKNLSVFPPKRPIFLHKSPTFRPYISTLI